jgi:hypothetical protein
MSDLTPSDNDLDESDEGINPDEAEKEIAAAKRRRKRLSLEGITIPQTTRHYSLAPLLVEPLKAVFTGDGITSHGGDFDKVMHLAAQVHNLAVSLGAHVELLNVFFGNSVTVEFRPIVAAETLREAQELADTDPDGEITIDEIERLIPASVVGAAAVARLLNVPPEDGLEQASRYGASTRAAYTALVEEVVERQGTIHLTAPGQREAELNTVDAEIVLEQGAPHEGERKLRSRLMRVAGTLSRIEVGDARRDPEFSLRLDPKKRPQEFPATRRYVEGRYTQSALDDVNSGGLVDQAVIATVRAWPVQVPGRSRHRFDQFVFEAIEPLGG